MLRYDVLYKLIIKSLDAIPYKGLFYIGKVLALLLYTLPNKHRRVSEANLKLVFPHTDCTIPYTQPKHKGLDKIITNSRNKSGVKMVDINVSGIKEMLSALKNKKLVAVASDQVPKKGAGIISKFFNSEIYSMSLLPKLQQRTGCVAHLMYCERKENGRGFVIHFDSKIDLSSNIQDGVDKMNNEFEKCIMKLPGQYSWEYKKFKRTELDSIYK